MKIPVAVQHWIVPIAILASWEVLGRAALLPRYLSLPSVIVAGLSAAMSGYAIWGHDVGGYQNTNFSISRSDLFMRWTQFGCFSPIMQMHRQVNPDPTDLHQYPWGYKKPGESVDDNLALAGRYNIRGVPAFLLFKDGQIRDQLLGACPKDTIKKMLDQHL